MPTAGYDVMEPIPVDLLNRNRLQLTDGRVIMLDADWATVGGAGGSATVWLAMSNETCRSSVWVIANPAAPGKLLATGARARRQPRHEGRRPAHRSPGPATAS